MPRAKKKELLPNGRVISLADAKRQFVHRFTVEHVPPWARQPFDDGTYPAPQYASDQEWYDNTPFPGEGFITKWSRYCQSDNQTWPLGQRLTEPYTR